jgi:hypothetical protein
MLDILVPAKDHAVPRAFEMCLAQKLLHLIAAEQLRAGVRQARVFAYLEQIRL